MRYDNVIPIDAEVARLLARRQTRFRWFVAALTAAWVAILVPTLLFTPLPPLGPFIALAVLVVLAEHRFVLFGDETSMSASIIVVIASVFVFADTSPVAGPMLIASLGGLYVPHLRSRSASLILANASAFGVSGAIAGAIATGFTGAYPASFSRCLGAALVCGASYWYANSVLTGSASAIRRNAGLATSVFEQATSEWPVLILAVSAGLMAMAWSGNILLVSAATTGLLGVFEVYVRRERRAVACHAAPSLNCTAFAMGLSASLLPVSVPAAAMALAWVFLAVSDGNVGRGRVLTTIAIVVALAGCSLALATADASVPLRFVLCTTLAVAAIEAAGLWTRALKPHLRIPWLVTFGLILPGRRDALAFGALIVALVVGDHLLHGRAYEASVFLAIVSIDQLRHSRLATIRPGRPTRTAMSQKSLARASR